jgi:hypothetical protein
VLCWLGWGAQELSLLVVPVLLLGGHPLLWWLQPWCQLVLRLPPHLLTPWGPQQHFHQLRCWRELLCQGSHLPLCYSFDPSHCLMPWQLAPHWQTPLLTCSLLQGCCCLLH